MKHLRRSSDPELIVGFETSDDAAVYRLDSEKAVINTVDFITPPVDDPWWFGQIAAANSISDVYAMGGKPIMALNLVMFPSGKLDPGVLREILRGGSEKVEESGAAMAGGHSVDDLEPKYGLAVTGIVHPERVWKNSGALPGDALVLTKPLGTGVLFNANRSGKLPYTRIEPLLPLIASLNRKAYEVAMGFTVHACTDISGFGFAGHIIEMARGSSADITIQYASLPIYEDAPEMYRKGETTRSNNPNRALCTGSLIMKASLKPHEVEILYDPQTSGGMLFSVPEAQADGLVVALKSAGVSHACRVGSVTGKGGTITVI